MRDSHIRSLVKGISWRVIGTIDTVVIAFLITGHINNAVKIGVTEVVTKIILYYLHERGWNFIQWGRVNKKPTHIRSFIKGVTWRITGTLDTIILSFLITGNAENAFRIGGAELVTKVIWYYIHERIWAVVKWGRIALEEEPAEAVPSEARV